MTKAIDKIKDLDKELCILSNIMESLIWDKEVNMPEMAIGDRADQLSALGLIIHKKQTDPIWKSLINSAKEEELNLKEKALLKKITKQYSKLVNVPDELVTQINQFTPLCSNAWKKARQANDFSIYQPFLSKMIDLQIKKAKAIDKNKAPYDVLLDDYESDITQDILNPIFDDLAPHLLEIIEKIEQKNSPDTSFLYQHMDVGLQDKFTKEVLKDLQYDFKRGRLDESVHPFSMRIGNDDVRITTKYNPNDMIDGLLSSIHECGHALYDLSYPKELRGSILANGSSMGMHESQARFWENMVGRSISFWENYLPKLQEYLPSLRHVSPWDFYCAINSVKRGFIRLEADEVSYSLHIILRYRLEQKLINQQIDTKDLDTLWKEEFSHLFGIKMPDSIKSGALHDIHWAEGAFGYFPSYALGNLYAAQFVSQMENEIGSLSDNILSKNFTAIISWWKEKVHKHGASKTPSELIMNSCNASLNPKYFIEYLHNRYSQIYKY